MLTSEQRQELIDQYVDGYGKVKESLQGLTDAQTRLRPIEGKWTACEIVHHLADSESISAHRLRRLLIEDAPLIAGYDQDEYAVRLRYNEREMAPALEAFRSARDTTTQLFTFMSDADWKRSGMHSENGPYSAEAWLGIYAAHAHNHAKQIQVLKQAILGAN